MAGLPRGVERVCFVHKGHSDSLQYAVSQARSCGYEAIVIGNDEANCQFASFFHIQDFAAGTEDFRKTYNHISVNPHDYEVFCFERWFIVRNFMRLHGGPIWMVDHDVLVYPGLDTLAAIFERASDMPKTLNSAWFTYIPDISSIDMIVGYFSMVYGNAALRSDLAQRNAIGGHPHISDMHLLVELSLMRPDRFINTAHQGQAFGVDTNYRELTGFSSINGHKLVHWSGFLPYAVTEFGKYVRFYCLHFQGPSKALMQFMHTIRPIFIGNRLSDSILNVFALPDDETGKNIKKAFRSLAGAPREEISAGAVHAKKRRHVFLDCGGHCGESIGKFLDKYPNFDFYTFEPNAALAQHVLTNIRAAGRTVFFSPAAVWIYDGEIEFFVGHDQGSTVMSGKVEFADDVQQVNYLQPIRVPCIDLSDWIARNIDIEDDLVIKMDVEGAEYEVLAKMVRDGTIDYVNRLYCEWHQDRFPDISQQTHESLVRVVAQRTDLQEWI